MLTHTGPLSLHDALPIYDEDIEGRWNDRPFVSARIVVDERIEPRELRAGRRVAELLEEGFASQELDEDEREVTNGQVLRSEEHTSELQSPCNLVCRLLLE